MKYENFYTVCEGEVYEIANDMLVQVANKCDFINSCICFCDNEEVALKLARKLDKGMIQPDNIILDNGEVIPALNQNQITVSVFI